MHYKAIVTRRGSKFVTATDNDGNKAQVRVNLFNGTMQVHHEAVRALCAKMGWSGALAYGAMLGGGKLVGYVYVWLDLSNGNAVDTLVIPAPSPSQDGTR